MLTKAEIQAIRLTLVEELWACKCDVENGAISGKMCVRCERIDAQIRTIDYIHRLKPIGSYPPPPY